jgi:Spy/CpxP family protein refolding chaperone
MMSRKAVLLLVMAVLTLSAGVVLGWVWTPHGRGGGPRPWFDQLDLSAEQQKQMDKIWGDTRQQMQKLFERRHDLEKQRDQQVLALLDSGQRAAYDKINQDFRTQREDFDKQRESLIADANARSRALLDPSQKDKWDILSKEMQMRRRRGPMGMATQHSTAEASPSAAEASPSATMPSHEAQEHQRGDSGLQ